MDIASPTAVVCGAGGFIGGHLVKSLIVQGIRVIRAIDIKPMEEWHQIADGVENLSLDLKEKEHCLTATEGADHVYQLAADMGAWGSLRKTRLFVCSTCSQTLHELEYWFMQSTNFHSTGVLACPMISTEWILSVTQVRRNLMRRKV